MKVKLNPFVYIRGNNKRGNEVIAELIRRGGINRFYRSGMSEESIYFINSNGDIDFCPNNREWITTHYEEIKLPYKPKDKELVWCWDDVSHFIRSLKFYDKVNNATFDSIGGMRRGRNFDNYAPYEGEYPDWAREALQILED